MSSPRYSEEATVLSSVSNNDPAYRLDPGTPDTDPCAFSDAGLENSPFNAAFQTLQHDFDAYGNVPYGKTLQSSNDEADVPATAAKRGGAEGHPSPRQNGSEWREIHRSTIPIDCAPIADRLYANQQQMSPAQLSIQILCSMCKSPYAIPYQQGEHMVPVSTMPICPDCLDITDTVLTLDTAPPPQQPIPILKQTHANNIVEEKPRHPCDQCEKTFGRLTDMQRHKSTIHQRRGRQYRCAECDYTNKRSDKMKEHCRKHQMQGYGTEQFTAEDA